MIIVISEAGAYGRKFFKAFGCRRDPFPGRIEIEYSMIVYRYPKIVLKINPREIWEFQIVINKGFKRFIPKHILNRKHGVRRFRRLAAALRADQHLRDRLRHDKITIIQLHDPKPAFGRIKTLLI